MSDLAAAAEAMGAPEEIVQRSAEARAQANGTSVDEVLAAWAGGGSATPAAPAETPEPAPADAEAGPEDEAPEEPAEPEPGAEPEPAESAAPAPATAPAASVAPPPAQAPAVVPVLEVEGADQPHLIVLGTVAVFVLLALLGWVFPSLPAESDQIVSSQIQFSEEALRGRELYQQLDCASCHTQMVRPLVADVSLGPVTLGDTNQVLGVRRIGPDLTYVGSRLATGEIQSVISGGGTHPVISLGDEDLAAITAYLTESRSENVESPSDE